jgi:hypothetical protein
MKYAIYVDVICFVSPSALLILIPIWYKIGLKLQDFLFNFILVIRVNHNLVNKVFLRSLFKRNIQYQRGGALCGVILI